MVFVGVCFGRFEFCLGGLLLLRWFLRGLVGLWVLGVWMVLSGGV